MKPIYPFPLDKLYDEYHTLCNEPYNFKVYGSSKKNQLIAELMMIRLRNYDMDENLIIKIVTSISNFLFKNSDDKIRSVLKKVKNEIEVLDNLKNGAIDGLLKSYGHSLDEIFLFLIHQYPYHIWKTKPTSKTVAIFLYHRFTDIGKSRIGKCKLSDNDIYEVAGYLLALFDLMPTYDGHYYKNEGDYYQQKTKDLTKYLRSIPVQGWKNN